MIKYIFIRREIEALMKMLELSVNRIWIFDSMNLSQNDYISAIESLSKKKIIDILDKERVSIDPFFAALLKNAFNPRIFLDVEERHLLCISNDIVIVFEQDARTEKVIKLLPFPDLNACMEYFAWDKSETPVCRIKGEEKVYQTLKEIEGELNE